MPLRILPHARIRMHERGASESEVIATVEDGERIPAKRRRVCFRRNFAYNDLWNDRMCATKQIEVIAVEEGGDWVVITVIAKYF